MALPAIEALAAHAVEGGRCLRVHAPAWGPELYGWIEGLTVVGRETPPEAASTGVLLKPSFGAAWRWRGLPERVGIAENARGWLLTRALPVCADEHRRDGYARVAEAFGAAVARPVRPAFRPRAPWDGPAVPGGFIALNAWGRTPATRWPPMVALADALVAEGRAVVFLAGPGEEAPVRALARAHTVVVHAGLAPLASLLDAAALVVSHDSGLAHFADACGARVLVLHGPTDPAVTGVGRAVVTADVVAASSGGTVSRPMSDLPLAQVHAAVQAALAPTG
jgi:ADP-heptose:LPS heptosyltransferase